jgi:hypothetical protein
MDADISMASAASNRLARLVDDASNLVVAAARSAAAAILAP